MGPRPERPHRAVLSDGAGFRNRFQPSRHFAVIGPDAAAQRRWSMDFDRADPDQGRARAPLPAIAARSGRRPDQRLLHAIDFRGAGRKRSADAAPCGVGHRRRGNVAGPDRL